MQTAPTFDPSELDSAGILAACRKMVPANTLVTAAIAAHKIALNHFRTCGTDEARTLAMYTLRSIILARTPTVSDCQQQLEYLGSLPEIAWDARAGYTPEKIREMVLADISRGIAWMQEK